MMKIKTEELLVKAYLVCNRYQKMPFKELHKGQLKHTHMWTRLSTLCEVLDIDDCWLYQELTGIQCDCNSETKVKAEVFLVKVRTILNDLGLTSKEAKKK